jgi:uncharacterized protein (DUF736 family)
VLVSTASAQELSLLVGGVSARYADSVSGTAGIVSARLAGSSPVAAGVIDAGFSRFSSGEWVTQISGYGTALARLAQGISVGIVAGGSANHTEGSIWVGELSAGTMLAVSAGGFLASAGLALGGVRTIEDTAFSSVTANARVGRVFRGGFSMGAGVRRVASDTTQYADFNLEAGLTATRLRANLSAGARAGDLADDPWAQARLDYAVSPQAMIEVAAGRYPRDLTGFTDGLFGRVGVRIALTRAARNTGVAPPPVVIEQLEDGQVRLSFGVAESADRLEIAGDWNGWEPMALRRSDSKRWWVVLRLDPGIHRYSLIVDGDTWQVPPGVPTEPDDFGGKVALMVVR